MTTFDRRFRSDTWTCDAHVRAERVAARALHPAERIHAPYLIDVEVAQVLRRLVHARELTLARGALALHDFAELIIERHPHRPLLGRIWSLRTALSAYDAPYVALAGIPRESKSSRWTPDIRTVGPKELQPIVASG